MDSDGICDDYPGYDGNVPDMIAGSPEAILDVDNDGKPNWWREESDPSILYYDNCEDLSACNFDDITVLGPDEVLNPGTPGCVFEGESIPMAQVNAYGAGNSVLDNVRSEAISILDDLFGEYVGEEVFMHDVTVCQCGSAYLFTVSRSGASDPFGVYFDSESQLGDGQSTDFVSMSIPTSNPCSSFQGSVYQYVGTDTEQEEALVLSDQLYAYSENREPGLHNIDANLDLQMPDTLWLGMPGYSGGDLVSLYGVAPDAVGDDVYGFSQPIWLPNNLTPWGVLTNAQLNSSSLSLSGSGVHQQDQNVIGIAVGEEFAETILPGDRLKVMNSLVDEYYAFDVGASSFDVRRNLIERNPSADISSPVSLAVEVLEVVDFVVLNETPLLNNNPLGSRMLLLKTAVDDVQESGRFNSGALIEKMSGTDLLVKFDPESNVLNVTGFDLQGRISAIEQGPGLASSFLRMEWGDDVYYWDLAAGTFLASNGGVEYWQLQLTEQEADLIPIIAPYSDAWVPASIVSGTGWGAIGNVGVHLAVGDPGTSFVLEQTELVEVEEHSGYEARVFFRGYGGIQQVG